MIEVSGVEKRFGEVTAVADLSLVAGDGAITGLLGPNGAGKTTALRIISTLMKADRGRVTVDGVDVAKRPAAARARLGLLPDSRGIYPRLTARENIRYHGRLHGLAGAALERRIDDLLAMLGLEGVADRSATGFSLGERSKVAIARALVHEPANVVLDEPTGGLDVMSIRSLRRCIRTLRDRGCCVVLSSHLMQEVAALCDHIIVMAEGRVVAAGTPADLREQTGLTSLEEAFVKLTLGDRYAEDLG